MYDIFPPSKSKKNSTIGEWNEVRILAKGSKVTHFLNGKKVLTFDRKSIKYKEAVKLSKYKESEPLFGDVKQGYILLQDHGDIVSFKNIKIKRL